MPQPADQLRPTQATIGVVVPAYNAEATLPACLAALATMTITPDEIIVIDDGSTDRTPTIARSHRVQLLTITGLPQGPAYARNLGVAALQTDFAMFVDADVIVHADALACLLSDLQQHVAIAAFGSYDDRPQSQRAASLYANLRHHYTHQRGRRAAGTFWSGISLIDRRGFLAAGRFDAHRYPRPSIEDVELGARLIRAGHRIRLVPAARGRHCKDWRAVDVWRTDIRQRAVPWTQLIVEGTGPTADLNLAAVERAKAAIALIVPISLAAALAWPAALWATGVAAVLYLAFNADFFAFLARRIKPSALVVAIAMHWFYHLYAAATFAGVTIWMRMKRLRSAGRRGDEAASDQPGPGIRL